MTSGVIRSTANPSVKAVVKLRNHRTRMQTGLFLVEGFREIRRALEAEIEFDQLWVCPELFLGSSEGELVDLAQQRGADVVETAAAPFRKISYRDRPEGLLAVCRQFDTSLEHITLSERPLVLVVEGIEKPGNLGTMIRAAGAAGADAVIVADPTTDVFNPNVVRSSIGTCFLVPIAMSSTDDAIAWLQEHSVKIAAATPDAELPLWEARLDGPVAIVVGSEQYGLSIDWLGVSEADLKIPMPGGVIDSLNAATSAAVLLFEAVRQRAGGATG